MIAEFRLVNMYQEIEQAIGLLGDNEGEAIDILDGVLEDLDSMMIRWIR